MEFDLDSNPVDQQGRRMFLERFIHGEAFRARPDVNAVVHSHSPTVIPFTVTDEPLRAVSHIASFLAGGCPCFEIRDVGLTHRPAGHQQQARRGAGQGARRRAGRADARPRQPGGRERHPARGAPRALHRGQRAAACHRAVVPAADQICRSRDEIGRIRRSGSADSWDVWTHEGCAKRASI